MSILPKPKECTVKREIRGNTSTFPYDFSIKFDPPKWNPVSWPRYIQGIFLSMGSSQAGLQLVLRNHLQTCLFGLKSLQPTIPQKTGGNTPPTINTHIAYIFFLVRWPASSVFFVVWAVDKHCDSTQNDGCQVADVCRYQKNMSKTEANLGPRTCSKNRKKGQFETETPQFLSLPWRCERSRKRDSQVLDVGFFSGTASEGISRTSSPANAQT